MKKGLLFIASVFSTILLFAQEDPVVMEVGNKKVTKSEFLQIYLKNNPNPKFDKAAIDEYLELFKKFKLKVIEAEAMGYDTIPKLKKELDGYRKTLATPYLVDNKKNESLVKQAYERQKTEIRASHILINVSENATPADTLNAYNRILALKKRIENGEDFQKVAKAKGGSEDPSVIQNGGDLGYFTAFQMVFPFEEAAYNTPVGKVSEIVRTKFGYHILKVYDTRPARGTMKTAHIMIAVGKEDSAEEKENASKKIQEIYEKALAGENFEELANLYSDDPGSSSKGGVLPAFGTGTTMRMVPEFEEAAFALKKDGEISKPLETIYGWHVIKRLEWSDLAPFESVKKELQSKVNRDERSKITQDSFVANLKKEYKYENKAKKGLAWFEKNLDTTYFQGKWRADKLKSNSVLFVLDGKKFTQQQFAMYLTSNYRAVKQTNNKDLIQKQFKAWEKAEIIAYEETKLEQKYPEFKALMQEYHDGILLYEVMTDQVWNRASKDTTGLKEYYQANKEKYRWEERADVLVYECYSQKIADEVFAMISKSDTITSKHVLEKINKDTELNLKVKTNKFEIKNTEFLKNQSLKKGINKPYELNGKFYVLKVNELIPAGVKELNEAKGVITSDYQNELEKRWLDQLAKKYPIKINEAVIYNLK
jgi:peptidyl-prolyl cis-trans isomerase SurA